jgi:hypothetical protein
MKMKNGLAEFFGEPALFPHETLFDFACSFFRAPLMREVRLPMSSSR